jgi:hypothetical protein
MMIKVYWNVIPCRSPCLEDGGDNLLENIGLSARLYYCVLRTRKQISPKHMSGPGQILWYLLWTKRHWGRFSPGTLVSPATYSIDCLTLSIILYPSSEAGTTGKIVVDIPSRICLVPPQETKRNTYYPEDDYYQTNLFYP